MPLLNWQTIIDFNFINVDSTHPTAFSGAALVGSSGDIWNSVGAHWSNPVTPQVFSDLALNDTSNNPTPVKMDFTAESFFGKLAGHDPRTWAFDGTPYEPLMDQYAYSEVGHATTSLTLKNLIPGLFDLYIYSSGSPDAVARISQFTVTTSNGSAVASAGPDGGVNTFEEGVNYVHFRPIVGNDGQISISGLGIGNETSQPPEADINGSQLVSAPEPTAVGMLLIGSCGFLARRRR